MSLRPDSVTIRIYEGRKDADFELHSPDLAGKRRLWLSHSLSVQHPDPSSWHYLFPF